MDNQELTNEEKTLEETARDRQYNKMVNTPIPKLVSTLAVPTIISMMVTNIYNLVDTAFVGKLGNSANAAVGIVFGFMSILQAVGFLFGQGSGSLVSRKLGEKKNDEASVVASLGFFSSFSCAIVLAVVCGLLLNRLVFWLGSTTTIAPYAKTYIFWIILAAPFIVSSFTLNNILRYEGKAILGMIGLLTGGVINIAGDALLMFGLNLGIAGAGISTALSQFISFCILLSMFLMGKTSSKISFKYLSSASFKLFTEIVSIGFPSLLRQILNSFTTVILNNKAGFYSDEAVAAMSNVSRLAFFTFSIGLGIGQGFQPVSAFNFGAGKYSRVKQAYHFTWTLATIILAVIGTVIVISPRMFLRILNPDATVVEIGTRALRLLTISQLTLPVSVTTEMMCQSTGKKIPATIMSGMRNGFIFIPALIILASLRGLNGIQEAQPIAQVLSIIPAIFIAIWFFKELPEEKES